jgi:hypothetical protein
MVKSVFEFFDKNGEVVGKFRLYLLSGSFQVVLRYY